MYLEELFSIFKWFLIFLIFTALFGAVSGVPFLAVKLVISAFLLIPMPGYLLSTILFPEKLEFTERISYSLCFGFAFFPFIFYYLGTVNVLIENYNILAVIVVSYLVLAVLSIRARAKMGVNNYERK